MPDRGAPAVRKNRMNIYNHKIKNKKAMTAIVLAVIAAMFLIRGLLLKNGTIDRMYTLEPDELHKALSGYEVVLHAGGVSGSGTILDARKHSTKDEKFTLTIATAAHVVGESKEAEVLLPDGTKETGTVLSSDAETDLAFVQCLFEEELEVYYSRDLLDRLAEEDPVYALKGENHSDLVSGTLLNTRFSEDGIGEELLLSDIGGENGMSGGGLYGKSGNYLGMIVQGTEDGKCACIPASTVMEAMKALL